MPHEIQFDSAGNLYIAERDNHVVRKVDAKTGIISTFAGTGTPGFSGDGGPATQAQLRQPHSIAVDPSGRFCSSAISATTVFDGWIRHGAIETYGGTGERQPTPDGAPVKGTPLNGPRTMAFDRAGNLYLALAKGNAIYRVDGEDRRRFIIWRAPASKAIRATGARPAWRRSPGQRARVCARHAVRGRHRKPRHSPHRPQDRHHHEPCSAQVGAGTAREPDPLRCALSRPHGVLVDAAGVLYVADSEAHRIRILT